MITAPSLASGIGSSVCPVAGSDIQQQEAILRAFLVTVGRFFGGFSSLFRPVCGPRHRPYITHPLPALLSTAVLTFLFRLGSRRQINTLLRKNDSSALKFRSLFGVPACPHGDTLNPASARLDPDELQEKVSSLVQALIRQKVLYRHRLFDRYFLIVIERVWNKPSLSRGAGIAGAARARSDKPSLFRPVSCGRVGAPALPKHARVEFFHTLPPFRLTNTREVLSPDCLPIYHLDHPLLRYH